MKRSVVIIEDQPEIAESISVILSKSGFSAKLYATAEDFLNDQNKFTQSIYLIDWNLPGMNGLDVVKTIRKSDKFSPIFMLTGSIKHESMMEALKSGVDDYITKPFSFDNLLVRVENAWVKLHELSKDMISQGVKLLPEAESVMRDGVTVNLTAREYIIFDFLMKSSETVSREDLISQFDAKEKMTVRNIDVHIFSLRKKLSKINMSIQTIWGAGYKLDQV
jgi:DNA-binding response OmpR family regulator